MIGCDFSVIVNGLSLGGGLGKMIGSDFYVIMNGLKSWWSNSNPFFHKSLSHAN